MKQEYALDWLDRTVGDLDPEQTEMEDFDLQQSQMIVQKALEEQTRVTSYLKRAVFQENKERHARGIVNRYFNSVAALINRADSNLKLVPESSVNFRSALESILACLSEVSAFIVDRYRLYICPDVVLGAFNIRSKAQDILSLKNCNLFKTNSLLSGLLIDEFSSTFHGRNHSEITFRKVDYWHSVIRFVNKNPDGGGDRVDFDNFEMMLIERNFNSPGFVKYLTSKFLNKLDEVDSQSGWLQELTFFQKSFNQIPVIKEMVYDVQYDDLGLTINNWFVHEISYRSRDNKHISEDEQAGIPQTGRYSRKIPDRILCNVTVDQLALFFKAADQSKIFVARSLSSIFKAVAPYLSTPNREEISSNSLRVKSYSVEERDKQVLLDVMDTLVKQIREL